jgi:ABC-type glutathione transport system ATPase component
VAKTMAQEEMSSEVSSSSDDLLVVEDLKKHFPVTRGIIFQRQVGAVKAVDGISFTVKKGETLGVVGESGCGKSTMARCVMKLLEPTAGRVVFDGRDISKLDRVRMRPVRREMMMIFQDPYASLNPRKRVGFIIAEALEVHKLGTAAEVKRRVQELLEVVGLNPEHYNRFPHEFSGGQRQRIGVARALAISPKLIVCDEPVSALDVSVQAQILNLLADTSAMRSRSPRVTSSTPSPSIRTRARCSRPSRSRTLRSAASARASCSRAMFRTPSTPRALAGSIPAVPASTRGTATSRRRLSNRWAPATTPPATTHSSAGR